jgi:hypothetical protein
MKYVKFLCHRRLLILEMSLDTMESSPKRNGSQHRPKIIYEAVTQTNIDCRPYQHTTRVDTDKLRQTCTCTMFFKTRIGKFVA